MGMALRAAGANFEDIAVSYIPPVTEGLRYWGFLNDSVGKLGKNFAPNGDGVKVVGSPAVDIKGATLATSAHIETAIQQSHSLTLIAIGHPVADGAEQGMFISNYSGGRPNDAAARSFGVSLYCSANEAEAGKFHVRASVARYPGTPGSATGLNFVTLANRDISKPAFFAMTFNGDEKVVRAYDLSVGDAGERPPIADATDVAITPFYIGSSPQTQGFVSNPRHMHFAAIYDRDLSKAELDLIYQRVKPYFANRGVNI
ncbi:hypothetical protein [Pseudomonas kermanshahensis]|jgi:hypothetical protein|uniref:hypothetical protein n=1 Tax=Pseudomonas kermanshahensis TaxID=2745482 RepID=UPI002093E6F6|nr:hypothetical protein [Pseudomonas kermanshahensis]USS56970.1 hypothetical protein NG836_08760 [Pseudomonas kermanshahensis]